MKKSQAGTSQSSDLMVVVEPANELRVEVESTVKRQYGHLIKAVVEKTLADSGVTAGIIRVNDRGALDYAIKARVETALQRAQ
ncbi:MAG: citrate lyase acyl carrier protein [Opitutaceae bacterium]|nr:citrate lyase acyl carrier protein [Opitutaceae bacterium]